MPDSSPDDVAQATDTTNTTVETPVENQASSSDVTADSSPQPAGSMLDAVQAALERKAESPTASSPDTPAEGKSDAENTDSEAAEEDLSADELKALSWKAQQRFRKLASTAKAKDGEVAALKPKAEEHDRIVAALTKAGIDGKQLDGLVELGSILNHGNPAEALARLMPLVQSLEQAAGRILPADLHEEVRLGYITEARAREIAESRATAKFEREARERQEQQSNAEKHRNEINSRVNASVSAIEAWEKQQAASDPDWPLKRVEIAEQVDLMIGKEAQKRGEPYFPTPDEAVKLSKEATKIINERIAKYRPKPSEIRPPSNPGASPRSKAAPKNILEAINNAL